MFEANALSHGFDQIAAQTDGDLDPKPNLGETRIDLPHGLLHEAFDQQATRTPDAVALVHDDRELTYGELDRLANSLATRLQHLGVGPDVPVAIRAEPGFEMMIGLLGILKAGAAYVPIAPNVPRERLRFILTDTCAPYLISQKPLPSDESDLPARVVTFAGDVVTGNDCKPRARIEPDNLAYVIYTSGSTGAPKGVMVSHRSIRNTLNWRQVAFPLNPMDRVLHTFSYTFDASIWELFGPLAVGARLVLAERDVTRDSRRVLELVAHHGVTVMQTTPSRLRLLLRERHLEKCDALRHVFCGGEALTEELHRQFINRLGARLHNMYGPTETAVDAACWTGTAGDRAAVPIGRPIAKTRLYLLDGSLRPVPAGDIGEIFIGGAGLARGYLGQPSLTASRFLPDPFESEPGARMYRTGDLGRSLGDGTIEFMGRADEQVKIRGYRIEPGEIEAALGSHPAVREAAVFARPESCGEARLIAYLGSAGEPRPAAEMRQYLLERVPEYMVPSEFIWLAELPRTTSGKLDRRGLPDSPATSAGVKTPPRGPVERFVAGLFSAVLNKLDVVEADNFFDLGGTSLQVAMLVHQLQDRLGEYVYTVAVYDAPTVAGLAEYLRTHYPVAIAHLFGLGAGKNRQQEGEEPSEGTTTVPMDDEMLAAFRGLVRTLQPRPPRTSKAELKNPPAVFVLSPPRSGSTLLRVLLGGHPALFAPPELQLLNFNTLAERRRAFDTDRDRFWLDGTVRAVMAARGCTAAEAADLMELCEREGLTVQEFYARLQGWLGNTTLVDKTPTYVMDPPTLRRAEEDFESPRYIHLVRHPSQAIASFAEAKLHVFFPPFFTGPHPYTVRQLAELIWTISHENILRFLEELDPQRHHRVYFEDLVREPRRVIEGIAEFLGVPFHSAMLDPFAGGHKSRMTDGLHPLARMLGDVKFHEHKGIESDAARWTRDRFPEEELGEPARRLARSLGYQIADSLPRAPQKSRSDGRSLVPLQTAGSRPPLFCVHPAGGSVFCYRTLARRLGTDQPVYAFTAPGLAGRSEQDHLEELAKGYVTELRGRQPRGPYRLAGWSVGGVIAFEMARQLSESGEEVVLLALFDSHLPDKARLPGPPDEGTVWAEVLASYGIHLPDVQIGPKIEITRIAELIAGSSSQMADFGPSRLAELGGQLVRTFQANIRAVQQYVPRPLRGRMVLFLPSNNTIAIRPRSSTKWSDLVAELVTHIVPGDHHSMLREPHVDTVAGLLQDYLRAGE